MLHGNQTAERDGLLIKASAFIDGGREYKFMIWAGDGTWAGGADIFQINI